MQLQKKLEAIVQPIVAEHGYEFIGLEFAFQEDEIVDEEFLDYDKADLKADANVGVANVGEVANLAIADANIANLSALEAVVIRVYVDRDAGVNVADCAKISRQIEEQIDVLSDSGNYTLEVSSPGVARRLFTLEQCRKHLGRVIELHLPQVVYGKLIEVEDQRLVLEVDRANGGKEKLKFDFTQVNQARVVPQW